MGPPVVATGTGFLEYFLPLMAILGDIIEIHHRRRHSRLGQQDDTFSVSVVQDLLSNYELSLDALGRDAAIVPASTAFQIPGQAGRDLLSDIPTPGFNTNVSSTSYEADQSKVRLVMAYSTHILHVLHVLLHGKWDAISMLDGGDDWITSKRFTECASHAISASQSVSTILTIDPELTFMSYLFGIYLLQGSFILLLFADRMPQLGPNESVEQACENIIRAHEVCVVTLNTDFQVRETAGLFIQSTGANRVLNRKTFEEWSGPRCIACADRGQRIGRSIEQGAEPCHCIGGRREQKAWHCRKSGLLYCRTITILANACHVIKEHWI